MGAHVLGAAAYATLAISLASPSEASCRVHEIDWQIDRMTESVRIALARLPLVGEDSSGPLGAGLLASGVLGANIRAIQAVLQESRS